MQAKQYPPDTGPYANLDDVKKKNRLDAMVRIWQSDTERRIERDGYRSFITEAGLHEYRYSVWMRFPEWERSAVVGQVVMLQQSEIGAPEDPTLFSIWRRDVLLKSMPEWKEKLPNENVFHIMVRITPGGLGEGVKWATAMPKEMIPRYKAGWPSQQDWLIWSRPFDWLSVAVPFIRAMIYAL